MIRNSIKRYGRQSHIVGGAAVLALTQFGASLAGLFRDRILAGTFPALHVVDVYIAAFRPSDLLFQIFIMAGFSTVLVPLLARYKAHDNHKEIQSLIQSVILMGSLLFGTLALILALTLPHIAHHLTSFTGNTLELYISFTRIALVTNALFVFGNAFGQYLITIQRYWIYGITPIIYTCGTIFGTIFFTPLIGPFGPMYGTLLGAFIYVLLRFVAFAHTTKMCHPERCRRVTFLHPDLKKMGLLMLPRMAALGALQFQLLFFDKLASGLPAGSVTINAYARNFQAVVVGIIGIAVAQSAYSALSQKAVKNEWHAYTLFLLKGIFLVAILSMLGSIGLAFVTPLAAWLVNLSHVLPVFSGALLLYVVSIPFESVNHLLLRAYYALHRTGIPALLTVLNGVIAIIISWYSLPTLGVFALPIGFTAGQIVQTVGLGLFLPRVLRKT